jgi:hypothetical protein
MDIQLRKSEEKTCGVLGRVVAAPGFDQQEGFLNHGFSPEVMVEIFKQCSAIEGNEFILTDIDREFVDIDQHAGSLTVEGDGSNKHIAVVPSISHCSSAQPLVHTKKPFFFLT